jgi:hypothetical protein
MHGILMETLEEARELTQKCTIDAKVEDENQKMTPLKDICVKPQKSETHNMMYPKGSVYTTINH